MGVYAYNQYLKSLPEKRRQGMLVLSGIFNDYLEIYHVKEEDIDYVNMINEIIIGPMEKYGVTWQDVNFAIKDWNESTIEGDYDEDRGQEFHVIDDNFFDTLERYWGIKVEE